MDRAEPHGVIGFPPKAGLGANPSGVDRPGVQVERWSRLVQWTRHPTRQPTFERRSMRPTSMVRIGGIRLVSAV
jgi:hypothetical protein